MSEEDKKLQKHLVNEMMKVSETNHDVMYYMEALMKYCIEIEEERDNLNSIMQEIKCLIHKAINEREINGVGELNLARIVSLIDREGDDNEK